jgi:hypothetical protein
VAVTATVFYQSIEAVVALHFLGNMADTNNNFVLEPCVLGGLCDGRTPASEPAVVEGAPPVPMIVRNWVITVDGSGMEQGAPHLAVYPSAGTQNAYQDTVVKVFFSQPVRGVDDHSLTLTDSHGRQVSAWVDQIGDGVWGLFPDPVLLKPGESYTAHLKAGTCAFSGACTKQDTVWKFMVCKEANQGTGDTSVASGFVVPETRGHAPMGKPDVNAQTSTSGDLRDRKGRLELSKGNR